MTKSLMGKDNNRNDLVGGPATSKMITTDETATTNTTTNKRQKKTKKSGKKPAAKKTTDAQSPESLFQQSVEWAKARHRLLRSVEGSEQENESSLSLNENGRTKNSSNENDKVNNVQDSNTNDEEKNEDNTHEKDENNVSALTADTSKNDSAITNDGEGGIVPFVSLIFGSTGNSHKNRGPSSLPNKEPLQILQNRKAFQKNHLRRFFAAMGETLVHIVENELFIPESNFELEEDETEKELIKGYNKKNNIHTRTTDANDTSHQISTVVVEPDDESTNALLYMRACAYAVEAYLEGELERRVKQPSLSSEGNNSSKTDQSKNDNHMFVVQHEYPVMDEVSMVASMLHDTIFSLESTICGKLGDSCQKDICKMCESWWFGMFQNRDPMVIQLVPLLFQKSLDYTTTYTTNANITLDHQAPNAHHHEPKLADIKRVWAMRSALNLFDFEEENIAYLKSLMLRSVSSPLYLKTNDGKRIIAELFQLHPSMTDDLHKAIKAQIPNAKKAVLQAYGDIYFRAWKLALERAPVGDDDDNKDDSDDDDSKASDDENKSDDESDDDDNLSRTHPKTLRQCIEEHALQDLMVGVLHAAEPMTAKALRTVLNVFHTSKRSPDVERLLYRLYGPILWRALKASHPTIKVNASAILADTFPLRDPTPSLMARLKQVSGAPTEDVLDKTVTALLALLHDDYPKVRVAGSDATARILAAFWDAIPPDHIRSLLNVIVLQHACDSSSAAVRVSSISAIMILLEEAPHTYHVLRALLPHMGNLIHDKVERVRLAVVKMLLCVSNRVEHIKFYHVVPVDHLLAQLAMEGKGTGFVDVKGSTTSISPVASALTELLLNSYFPQGENVTGSMQVQRSLGLMSSHPNAATVFYQHLSQHLSVNSIAKLIHMLHRCFIAAIQAYERENDGMNIDEILEKEEKDETQSNEDENNEDNREDSEESKKGQTLLIASNTSLMKSMTETISILWSSIYDDLNDESKEASRTFLHKSFEGDALLKEYTYFQRLTEKYGKRYHIEMKKKSSKSVIQQLLRRITDCRSVCGALLTCGTLMPLDLIPKFVETVTKDLWPAKRKEVLVSNNTLMSPREQKGPFQQQQQQLNKGMSIATPQALSLLCRWNKTEDIVNEACLSIRSFFGLKGLSEEEGEGGTSQHDYTLNIIIAPVEEKQNDTTATKATSKKTTLAQVEMAISVLQHILRFDATSSYSSTLGLTHRESLLQSKIVLNNVEDSLKGAFYKLNDIFRDPSSGATTSSEEWNLEDVKMMILAFECYCRLLIHKLSLPLEEDEEEKKDDYKNETDDNDEGKDEVMRDDNHDEEKHDTGNDDRGELIQILQWITKTVLPAIQRPSIFSDMLDISKIAPMADLSVIASTSATKQQPVVGNNSRASVASTTDRNSIGEMVLMNDNESIAAAAPRLSNISSTLHPSGVGMGMGVSFMNDVTSPLDVYVQALATVMIHATCVFTAEWLALGGCYHGCTVDKVQEGCISSVDKICTELKQWLVVFKHEQEETTVSHKDSQMNNSILLSSMGRLIVQLIRSSSRSSPINTDGTTTDSSMIAFRTLLETTKPWKLQPNEEDTIGSVVRYILTMKPATALANLSEQKNNEVPLAPREEAIKIIYDMIKIVYLQSKENVPDSNQRLDSNNIGTDHDNDNDDSEEGDDSEDIDDFLGLSSSCSTMVAFSKVLQHSASCGVLANLIVYDIKVVADVESDENLNIQEEEDTAEIATAEIATKDITSNFDVTRTFASHMARKLMSSGKLSTAVKKNVQDALMSMEKKVNIELEGSTTTSTSCMQEPSSLPEETGTTTTEMPMDTDLPENVEQPTS